MTPDDIDRAALDLALHRRAAARCATAKPHRDTAEDWPCSGCLLAVARQLAISTQLSAPASAPLTGGPASAGSGALGAAGCVPAPPSGQVGGSTQKDNRARAITPDPAEGATGIARNERMPWIS